MLTQEISGGSASSKTTSDRIMGYLRYIDERHILTSYAYACYRDCDQYQRYVACQRYYRPRDLEKRDQQYQMKVVVYYKITGLFLD